MESNMKWDDNQNDRIKRLLNCTLSKSFYTKYDGSINIKYVPYKTIIKIANLVFGFDGWSGNVINQELKELECLNNSYMYHCTSKVSITLKNGATRTAIGNYVSIDDSPGTAICQCSNISLSNAYKSAFMQFGNIFDTSIASTSYQLMLNEDIKYNIMIEPDTKNNIINTFEDILNFK